VPTDGLRRTSHPPVFQPANPSSDSSISITRDRVLAEVQPDLEAGSSFTLRRAVARRGSLLAIAGGIALALALGVWAMVPRAKPQRSPVGAALASTAHAQDLSAASPQASAAPVAAATQLTQPSDTAGSAAPAASPPEPSLRPAVRRRPAVRAPASAPKKPAAPVYTRE
jgi:hypothetical protein